MLVEVYLLPVELALSAHEIEVHALFRWVAECYNAVIFAHVVFTRACHLAPRVCGVVDYVFVYLEIVNLLVRVKVNAIVPFFLGVHLHDEGTKAALVNQEAGAVLVLALLRIEHVLALRAKLNSLKVGHCATIINL